MEWLARLNEFISSQRITDAELASMWNVTEKTVYNRRKGIRKMEVEELSSILISFPNLSAEWLLLGKGEMLNGTKREGVNVQGNHNITAGSNITIGGTTTDRCENCAKPVPLITTEISRLPDVDVMQEIKDGELDISHTLQVQQFGDYTAAYVVQNDAMGESFVKGDRVAIKYQSFMNVINGNIYVVDSKRGMFLRRAYELDDNTFMFRSDNPQLYSDMKMSKDEVYSLFVVVGLLRILY